MRTWTTSLCPTGRRIYEPLTTFLRLIFDLGTRLWKHSAALSGGNFWQPPRLKQTLNMHLLAAVWTKTPGVAWKLFILWKLKEKQEHSFVMQHGVLHRMHQHTYHPQPLFKVHEEALDRTLTRSKLQTFIWIHLNKQQNKRSDCNRGPSESPAPLLQTYSMIESPLRKDALPLQSQSSAALQAFALRLQHVFDEAQDT